MTASTTAPAIAGQPQSAGRDGRARRRDFYRRYDVLLANWYLLTPLLQQQLEVIREELHADLASWRPQQSEPDWSRYEARLGLLAGRALLH
jgi:hypothetical protein